MGQRRVSLGEHLRERREEHRRIALLHAVEQQKTQRRGRRRRRRRRGGALPPRRRRRAEPLRALSHGLFRVRAVEVPREVGRHRGRRVRGPLGRRVRNRLRASPPLRLGQSASKRGRKRARRERRLRLGTPRGALRVRPLAHEPHGERGVEFLMRAGEAERDVSLAGVGVRSKGRRHLQRRADLRRALAQHRHRLFGLWRRERGRARFEDARLLARDLRQGVAQDVDVVQPETRHAARRRRAHQVRRV